jgi:hypothetical protein
MKTPALGLIEALISNWIAPSIALPLGAMYSSVPSKVSLLERADLDRQRQARP